MEDRKNMKLEDRVALAMAYHDRGFNCAQAVACAYCDKAGIDEKTMFQLTEGFGLGMGGMQATCGAVSGAVMLAGLKNSCGDLEAPMSKGKTYQIIFPAGTDYTAVLNDEDMMYGYFGVAEKLGLTVTELD